MLRTIFVVSLLLLSGVSLAQMSPAVEATPTASPAKPEAGPSVSMVTPTTITGRQHPTRMMRWRDVRIVALVLKAMLVVFASFALIALAKKLFEIKTRFCKGTAPPWTRALATGLLSLNCATKQ